MNNNQPGMNSISQQFMNYSLLNIMNNSDLNGMDNFQSVSAFGQQQRPQQQFFDMSQNPPLVNRQPLEQGTPYENNSSSSSSSGSSAKPKHRRDITIEHIQECFDLPEDQAAKKLRVSKTHLKRLCREYNIRRWPYRRLKSFSARIEKAEKTLTDSLATDSEKQSAQQEMIELEKRRNILIQNPCVVEDSPSEHGRSKVRVDHVTIGINSSVFPPNPNNNKVVQIKEFAPMPNALYQMPTPAFQQLPQLQSGISQMQRDYPMPYHEERIQFQEATQLDLNNLQQFAEFENQPQPQWNLGYQSLEGTEGYQIPQYTQAFPPMQEPKQEMYMPEPHPIAQFPTMPTQQQQYPPVTVKREPQQSYPQQQRYVSDATNTQFVGSFEQQFPQQLPNLLKEFGPF